MQNNKAIAAAQQQWRSSVAELCYYYPQYEISQFGTGGIHEDMPLGDIELLLTKARVLYYQSKLDDLYVATGAQSKKGFGTVKKNLSNLIKKLKASI